MTMFVRGDRVQYVGNNIGEYQEPEHYGALGTVIKSGPDQTMVSWDAEKISTPSRAVFTVNLSRMTPLNMTKDPHIGEQITRAEWHAKPTTHGKEDVNEIPLDDPRVAYVARSLETFFGETPLSNLDYPSMASVAISALRDFLTANRAVTWTVTLDATGDRKIQVIKEIRAQTALGLKEAKDLTEARLPVIVKSCVTEAEAWQCVLDLRGVGASATATKTY
jgi:large subunit ribosomal protein L7/L12